MGVNDIYLVMGIYNTISILGMLFVFLFIYKIQRRFLNICGFILLTVLGFSLFLYPDYRLNSISGMQAFSLSCLIKMINDMIFSMIFNYVAELFPTKIRGFTSGFLVFIARISNTLAPTLI